MTESKDEGFHGLTVIDQLKTVARPIWRDLRINLYSPHWVATTEIAGIKLALLSKSLNMQNNIEHLFNETEYLEKILEIIKPSDNVLEIGSYIGLHALLFASKAKHVYCVEPDPNCQNEIIRNAAKNNLTRSITIFPAAAWDKNQILKLECKEMYWRTSRLRGTVNANDNLHSPRNFKAIIEVEGKTLDNLADEIKQKIASLKIDTEGAELHILKGGTNFWQQPPRVVAIEKHQGYLAGWGQKPEDIDQFMEEKGYKKTFESQRNNEQL